MTDYKQFYLDSISSRNFRGWFFAVGFSLGAILILSSGWTLAGKTWGIVIMLVMAYAGGIREILEVKQLRGQIK